MTDSDKWRSRAMRGLEAYFRRRSFPRLALGLVLLLTGLAGFGISFLLLRGGLGAMWLRYPLAVLGAYGIFLLLMRLWVEFERQHFDPNDPEVLAALEGNLPDEARTGKSGSWLDWLDVPFDPSLLDAEGCLVGLGLMVLIGVAIGLIACLLAILSAAPALIAEVFVDAILVGVLYRRLKIAAREHWLGTCLRKTWPFVACTAALLFVVGIGLTTLAPGAHSIGPALEEIFRPKN